MKNAYFIPNIQFKAPKKIDPLRVSQSISKNMMKDLNKDNYGGHDKDIPKDVNLANRDQEILIGGDIEEKMPNKKYKESDLQTIDKNEIISDIKDSNKAKTGGILGDKKAGKEKRVVGDDNEIKKDTTSTQPMGLDPNAQS